MNIFRVNLKSEQPGQSVEIEAERFEHLHTEYAFYRGDEAVAWVSSAIVVSIEVRAEAHPTP